MTAVGEQIAYDLRVCGVCGGGEERPNRAVDHARHEYFVVGRADVTSRRIGGYFAGRGRFVQIVDRLVHS